ncbi:MAG: phosphoribosylglycinamide formyltransferase [Gammaproteobacteria bacterium]|nr:MAG: phosphoribosylglycinamide formyltransferase [Gammaproteobacteria bacterium]
MPANKLPIVVLISGSGSNLQAIIDAIAAGKLQAEIRAVISNRPDVLGLQRAQKAGIETVVLDHKNFTDRESFDAALQDTIDAYQPRLIILAGFMRILSDGFVDHYAGRMLNIHPSLLPDFRGLNTHQRVVDAGCKQHGVTVHFVTNELDSGPLVIQAVIDVHENDTAETLEQRIHTQEHIIYPMAIQWFAEGRLRCNDNKVYLDNSLLLKPPRWINNELVITA